MTDPRELITRLRQLGSGVAGTISGEHCPLLNEAADAIEEMLSDLQAIEKESRPDPSAGDKARIGMSIVYAIAAPYRTLTPREPNE